jgi:uncharacterized protein YcbK (DUF882 family)
MQINRRELLTMGLVSASLTMALPTPSWAQNIPEVANDFWRRPRTVKFRHLNGEYIESTYWIDGEIQTQAYQELCWFMRDRYAQRQYVRQMDVRLLDVNYAVGGWLRYFGVHDTQRFHHGARDPMRAHLIEGAARDSRHHTGQADDTSIPGVSALQQARFGVWLQGGGVGWYQKKEFTHIDTGRLRVWRG